MTDRAILIRSKADLLKLLKTAEALGFVKLTAKIKELHD